ncbi:hypothetical protein ADEAN_000927700 [Angomonas deanei]|uniref:RING-type domain-containing protein n=1 Tax=Angomonas deanei TaxID=59799 RepID=A0A7G2CU30_9TRYP|nr:hypothetical protein ADEAN_000927700 [Angomonas deanei]
MVCVTVLSLILGGGACFVAGACVGRVVSGWLWNGWCWIRRWWSGREPVANGLVPSCNAPDGSPRSASTGEPVANGYVLTADAVERHRGVPPVNAGASDAADPAVCCVCSEEPEAFYMFQTCGHVCICEGCMVRMGTKAKSPIGQPLQLDCPMCRERSTLRRVYFQREAQG